MSDISKEIVRHLHAVATMQEIAEKAGLTSKIQALQEWQCKRLIASHQDLWDSPKFKPAMQFFIDELYGPNDFSQRDQDIAKVVPKMAKLLPEKALLSLSSALYLNAISYELDFAVARQLPSGPINRDTYAAAYCNAQSQTTRTQQIDYIERLGVDLAEVVKIRGISMLLKMSRKPAKLAGVLSLHEFIEQGFHAFKQLGEVRDFIDPVVQRERTTMRQLFAGENPLPNGI